MFFFLQLILDHFIPEHALFGIGFALLLYVCHYFNFLNFKPLIFLGKISFSAYFSHFAVLSILNKYGLIDYFNVTLTEYALINFAIRLIVVLFLVIFISTPMFYFIETPSVNLGYLLIKNNQKKYS